MIAVGIDILNIKFENESGTAKFYKVIEWCFSGGKYD